MPQDSRFAKLFIINSAPVECEVEWRTVQINHTQMGKVFFVLLESWTFAVLFWDLGPPAWHRSTTVQYSVQYSQHFLIWSRLTVRRWREGSTLTEATLPPRLYIRAEWFFYFQNKSHTVVPNCCRTPVPKFHVFMLPLSLGGRPQKIRGVTLKWGNFFFHFTFFKFSPKTKYVL